MRTIHHKSISAMALAAGMLLSASVHANWTFGGVGTSVAGSGGGAGVTGTISGVYATNGAGNVGFAANATWSAKALANHGSYGWGMYSGSDSGSPQHALDNNGTTEAVILQFTSSVVLSSIGLGYTSDNNSYTSPDQVDISLFRWKGAGTPTGSPSPLVGQSAAAMTGWELVGNYGDMLTDTSPAYNLVNSGSKGSSWWMISAYNSGYSGAGETRGTLDQGNDYFKLYAVAGTKCTSTVPGVCGPGNQTPEPSSLALMGMGVLGLVGLRRRYGVKAASQA